MDEKVTPHEVEQVPSHAQPGEHGRLFEQGEVVHVEQVTSRTQTDKPGHASGGQESRDATNAPRSYPPFQEICNA